MNDFSFWEGLEHGNHLGMEILFLYARKLSYAEKEITNSQAFSLSWLIKTSRQVVIIIYRQRTNQLIRLGVILINKSNTVF